MGKICVLNVTHARVMSVSPPVLPPEIILAIIQYLIPADSAIFPANHPVTRTLYSLTVASQTTHDLARPALLDHCAYIDSSDKLRIFLSSNKTSNQETNNSYNHPSALYLAPALSPNTTPSLAAIQISTLFSTHCKHLRRLLLDTTWTAFHNSPDTAPTLHLLSTALRDLPAIEEFISIQQPKPPSRTEQNHLPGEIWSSWPRLRRLALYGVFLGRIFIEAVQRCPRLTHLVLGSPVGSLLPLPDETVRGVSWETLGLQSVVVVTPGQEGFWADARADSELARLGWRWSPLGRLAATLAEDCAEEEMGEQRRFLGHVALSWDGVAQGLDPAIAWLRERALDGSIWERRGEVYKAGCR
ncbi:hypothetical protein BJX64DRAFT_269653 [Aspergillus heterothallicus]